jgi:hypothetical protein
MSGLVASGQSKSLSSHARHGSERGIFRPSYGNLCERLMATNGTPLLMMSATCRPIVIEKIIGSLKLYIVRIKKTKIDLSSESVIAMYNIVMREIKGKEEVKPKWLC